MKPNDYAIVYRKNQSPEKTTSNWIFAPIANFWIKKKLGK